MGDDNIKYSVRKTISAHFFFFFFNLLHISTIYFAYSQLNKTCFTVGIFALRIAFVSIFVSIHPTITCTCAVAKVTELLFICLVIVLYQLHHNLVRET